jgi:hypothetical protein
VEEQESLVGKANILNSQIQLIVSFLGSSCELPKCVEKELDLLQYQFLWGGSCKATKSLSVKSKPDGGLGVPHFRSRVNATHCQWIYIMSLTKANWTKALGVTVIDWNIDASFHTLFDKPYAIGFAEVCLNAWVSHLAVLDPDYGSLVWPFLPSDVVKSLGEKCKNVTFADVKVRNFNGLSMLGQNTMVSCSEEVSNLMLEKWSASGREALNVRFKSMNHQKWVKKLHIDSDLYNVCEFFKSKYAFRNLLSFDTQKSLYGLFMDALVPPPHKFRNNISFKYALDWKLVNNRKMFVHSRIEAFNRKSQNGKLYGNKDLTRFGVKDDPACRCGKAQQTSEHVMLECSLYENPFTRFEKEFGVTISECERLVGVDTTIARPLGILKRLNIMRKYVYDINCGDKIGVWDGIREQWDRIYVEEYAIGSKKERELSDIQSWEVIPQGMSRPR